MYGLPLHVYNNKTLLIPLFTLNDLELLGELNGYTIGTTNVLLLQLPHVKADAYINIDAQTFVVENKLLVSALKPTSHEVSMVRKLLKVLSDQERCCRLSTEVQPVPPGRRRLEKMSGPVFSPMVL